MAASVGSAVRVRFQAVGGGLYATCKVRGWGDALSIQHDGIYAIAIIAIIIGLIGGAFAARYTKKVWWGILVHLVILILASLLTVSGAFLILNRKNGWYSTLAEVMGTEKYAPANVQDFGAPTEEPTPTASAATPTATPTPVATKPPRNLAGIPELPSPGAARQAFSIPASKGKAKYGVHVWLPPQYFQADYADKTFPVVMLGSGYPGTPTQWYDQTNIVGIVTGLVESKKIAPLILVQPTLFPNGHDTECTWGPSDDAEIETWLAKDIPQFLIKRLRVVDDREGWAWMGISTGAYCGIMQTMYHPDSYRAVIGLGGYYRPRWANVVPTWPDTDPRMTRLELPDTIGTVKGEVAFWLMNTATEPEFSKDAKKFASSAVPPVRVTLVNSPQGGHNWQTWLYYAPQGLTWLGKTISAFAPH